MTDRSDNARAVSSKHMADIRREWDRIAKLRFDQIVHGRDLSYSSVLEPTVLELIGKCDRSSVLDVGCGVGILTARLAEVSGDVIGIDISGESIALAEQHQTRKNLHFVTTSVETFARDSRARFTVVVANMTLMTMLDLPAAIDAISRLLTDRGRLILTITHPCFWPAYWHYDNEEWFDYSKEIVIEAPFRISADGLSKFTTTHVHRPLEQYFASSRLKEAKDTSPHSGLSAARFSH